MRPFDKDFVLNITREHMLKSIDISINKTTARLPEFIADPVKSNELFQTLAVLAGYKKKIEAF